MCLQVMVVNGTVCWFLIPPLSTGFFFFSGANEGDVPPNVSHLGDGSFRLPSHSSQDNCLFRAGAPFPRPWPRLLPKFWNVEAACGRSWSRG